MKLNPVRVLLADDDLDDCLFFKRALEEFPLTTQLTIVHDGEELMKYLLENTAQLPDILFLDLSMPRKTGFECLIEINENEQLQSLHVVMFSTSYARDIHFEQGLIITLRQMGSQEFIRKPSGFTQLKEVIHGVINQFAEKKENGIVG